MADKPKSKPPAKTAKIAKPKLSIVSETPVAEGASNPKPDRPVLATLRVKELIERVSEHSGGKRKEVKEIVEATLAEIAAALNRGESLNLPAIGKLRVSRTREVPNGKALTLKLRQHSHAKTAASVEKEGLAEDEDQV